MSKDFSATGLKPNRVRNPVDAAVSFLIWGGTICTLISGVLFLIPQLTGEAALGAFSGLTAFADAILWALMISTLVQVASEAYSKFSPAAKNTNPRTTENTRPYNPNGRLNPVCKTRQVLI